MKNETQPDDGQINELISKITVWPANFRYIASTGQINGALLADLRKMLMSITNDNKELQNELDESTEKFMKLWSYDLELRALNDELLDALEKLLMAAEYSRYVQKSATLEQSMITAKVLINKAKIQ